MLFQVVETIREILEVLRKATRGQINAIVSAMQVVTKKKMQMEIEV